MAQFLFVFEIQSKGISFNQGEVGPHRLSSTSSKSHNIKILTDFPGGSVVKNPYANAGDMGLIPGLGWEDPTCLRTTKPMSHNW